MEDVLNILVRYSGVFSVVLSAVAIIIALLSYKHSRSSDKEEIKRKMHAKMAELKSIENKYFNREGLSIYYEEREQMAVRRDTLKSEIDYLKRCL